MKHFSASFPITRWLPLLAAFWLPPGSGWAQTTNRLYPAQTLTIPVTGAGAVSPTDIDAVSGDFDGDGDQDVAVADYTNGVIHFVANVNGTLTYSNRLLGVPRMRQLKVRDDRALVIFYDAGSGANGGMRVLNYNPATTGWDVEQDLPLTAPLVRVTAGDTNGDGLTDFIGATATGALWQVCHSVDATGAHSYSVGSLMNPRLSVCGPITDLALTPYDVAEREYYLISTASCSGPRISVSYDRAMHCGTVGDRAIINTSTNPTNVTVGDVNGDGAADAVLVNHTTGQVMLSLNIEALRPTSTIIDQLQQPTNAVIADVDGDGVPEIIYGSEATASVWVNLLVEPVKRVKVYPMDRLIQIMPINMTPDPSAEVLAIGKKGGGMSIDLTVLDSGPFVSVTSTTPAANASVVPPASGPLTFTVSLNAALTSAPTLRATLVDEESGKSYESDLPLLGPGGTTVSYIFTSVQYPYKLHSHCTASTPLLPPVTIAGGSTSPGVDALTVRFSLRPTATDGRLGAGVAQPTPTSRRGGVRVAAGDVNGDGLTDLLLVSNRMAGSSGPLGALYWQQNLGNDAFAAPAVVATFADSVRDVVAGDFNADGLLDVAVLRDAGTGSVVERFEGSAAGGPPTSVASYAVRRRAKEAIRAELEREMNRLIIIDQDTLTVLDMTNGSSFAVGLAPAETIKSKLLRAIDASLVIRSGGATAPVIVDEIDLARGTSRATNYGAGLFGVGAQLADVTGDGIPDLVAAETGRVRCKPGLATGGFGTVRTLKTLPVGFTPADLYLNDLNGDGVPEMILRGQRGSAGSPIAGIITSSISSCCWTGEDLTVENGGTGGGLIKIEDFDSDNDGDIDVVAFTAAGASLYRNGADDFPDLTITGTETIPGGNFRNITVAAGGDATLALDQVPPTTFRQLEIAQAAADPGPTFVRIKKNSRRPLSGDASLVAENVVTTGTAPVFRVGARCTLTTDVAAGISSDGRSLNATKTALTLQLSDSADYLFDGATAQVTGAGLPLTVRRLTCANPAGLTLSRNVSVREQAVVAAGSLVSNGRLSLLSNAACTAIAVDTGGNIIGNVRVQNRIRPVAGGGFRHVASPVTTIVSDLTVPTTTAGPGFLPVVNAAYNTATNPAAVRPAPTVFGYDESRLPTAPDFGLGWFSPAATTSALLPGQGYSALLPANLTYDVVGPLAPAGPVSIGPLTRTGNFTGPTEKSGWKLAGNPLAMPLDWDNVAIPAGLSPSISVWESTGGATGVYRTRANGVGSLADGLIPVHQSFFCRVTGSSATLVIDRKRDGVTTACACSHLRPVPAAQPLVTLTLRAVGAPVADEATLYFAAAAAAGLDVTHDAPRPGRNVGVPTLALVVGGEELALEGQPQEALAAGTTAEVLAVLPTAGTYELALTEAALLEAAAVTLLDRLTGTRYDLRAQPMVRFATAAGEQRDRFALEVGGQRTVLGTPAYLTAGAALTLWPNPAHAEARLTGALPLADVVVVDALGRAVARTTADAAGTAALPLAGLRAGVYTVRAGGASQRLVVE